MRRLAITLAAVLIVSTLVSAQQPPPPPPPTQTRPAPEPVGQALNVKIELTITDQAGTGEPMRKTITLHVADRAIGSIRNIGTPRGQINLDARPTTTGNNNIRLALGLEYDPRTIAAGSAEPRAWSMLNEQITVVLESGKPLIVSQAADPASDRKVSVEVKATIAR